MSFKPHGVIVPIVTPLDKDGKFNATMMRRLVNHLIDGGVHGLFPLGTTGEFYAFDDDTALEIFETVVDEAAGRVPVYGGANSITTQGAVRLVKLCERAGVDAVSVLTPMFISQTQDELYEHYRAIAGSTALPIILYNNRPKTNVQIEPQTVVRLAQIENIVGIKDSTGDMTNSAEYIRLTRGIAYAATGTEQSGAPNLVSGEPQEKTDNDSADNNSKIAASGLDGNGGDTV